MRAARDRRWIGRGICLLAWLGTAAVVGAGCAAERPFVWVQNLSDAEAGEGGRGAVIESRDAISVFVKNQPTLSGEFVVREDGGYVQPLLGDVAARGRSPAELAAYLQGRLKEMVVNPEVTVVVARPAPIRVNVVGEVKTPGAYELARDRAVIPALAAAGWLTDFAHRDRVFVLRAGSPERRVRFKVNDLTSAEPHAARFRLRDGDVIVVE